LFFTAEKRHAKGGTFEIVFFVSNFEAKPSDYLDINSIRWYVEKFFRTGKQKGGFSDCRMISNSKQSAHLWAVFFTYAIATKIKIANKYKNVDQVFNFYRDQKRMDFSRQLCDSEASLNY
jgi:hypothetical protein